MLVKYKNHKYMRENRYTNVDEEIKPSVRAVSGKRTVRRSPKSKIMVSVRLTPYLYQETARIADERGCSLSLAVRALLQYALNSEDYGKER